MSCGLGVSLPASFADFGIRQRVRALPAQVEARGRRDGAVHRVLPAGRDVELHGVEEPRRAQLGVLVRQLLVAVELVERLVLPAVAERRALGTR